MSKFALITAHHDGTYPVLAGRNLETGKKGEFTIPFKPYFFVEDNQGKYLSIEGKRLKRIDVEKPSAVPTERAKYPVTFEADIPFARRYLIDKNIKSGFEVIGTEIKPIDIDNYIPDIWYLDLECYPHSSKPEPEKDFITCIGISTNQNKGIITLMNEGIEFELLNKFKALFDKYTPDVVASWGSYDKEALEARCKANNVFIDFHSTNWFSLLDAYRKLFSTRFSNRLRDVAFDEGIINRREEMVDYRKLYDEDKEALKLRNAHHVSWLKQIDQKHKIIDYHWELKQFCGVESLENTLYASVMVDTLLLREYKDKYILPSKSKHIHETYEGALIMQPPSGVYHNVAILDVKSYYPHILIQENLSPEIVNGVASGTGIVPKLIQRLLDMKQSLSGKHGPKLMAIKGIVNSAYGFFSFPGSRLYNQKIGARVAEAGREGLTYIMNKTKELKYNTIYADTDSTFISVKDKDEAIEITNKLNEHLKSLGDYDLKLEKFCDSILFTGVKKRYIHLSDGEYGIKGFEYVRGDSAEITKEAQMEVLKMILSDNGDKAADYLRSIINNYDTLPIDKIAIPKTLSKGLTDYASNIDYVRGAKWAVDNLKVNINAGDKLWILYCLEPTDVIAIPDLNLLKQLKFKIDRQHMIQRTVLGPLEDILKVVGIGIEEAQGQGRLL